MAAQHFYRRDAKEEWMTTEQLLLVEFGAVMVLAAIGAVTA